MNDHQQPRHEDPATTHARLTAAACAEHANACAAAAHFLSGETIPEDQVPPNLQLLDDADDPLRPGRRAVLDPGDRDQRSFTSRNALDDHARNRIVISLTVRRDGWTVPEPGHPHVEPDTARLLLRAANPVVDIVAGIAMNGTLDAPRLRYRDANDRMTTFDHATHELDENGIRYLASLFILALDGA